MTMGLRLLGRTGIRVSELCLGAMTFGTEWGWGTDEAESRRIYHAYREAGSNFVDTADIYNDGTSETIVGGLIGSERDSVVVATKFTFPKSTDNPNSSGSHRKNLRHSIETSLRRLGTDYVDLIWVHAWDQCTPSEETMRALDDLIRTGSVLGIGVSNTPAWVAARSHAIAELRGWTAYCGMQVEYSLAERSAERELLPMARALGLTPLAWSPLGRGALTGAHDRTTLSALQRQGADAAAAVAQDIGVTAAQVALAWILRQGVMPVLGARRLEQIEDNLKCLDVRLEDEQLEILDTATRIDLGYPTEWLNAPHRRAIFTREALEEGGPGVALRPRAAARVALGSERPEV